MQNRMILVFVAILLSSTALLYGQRISAGTGFHCGNIKSNEEYSYLHFKKIMPITASYYHKDLRYKKNVYSLGLRFSTYRINGEYKEKNLDENRLRSRLDVRLSSFLVNLRSRIITSKKNRFNVVLNNSVGLAVHTFINGGPYWDGCSTSIKYMYAPGLEFLFPIHENLSGFITVQYYLILGKTEILYPFSSFPSVEFGIAL